MAAVGSSSSQNASSSGTKISDSPYRVFLSFRGSDTRYTFADHLYTALEGAGIGTFRDEEKIEKGKKIYSEIVNAIEASQSAVIVFSENFASSKWCLEEVAMIMERKKTYGEEYFVLPVFHHVDPAHVRYQTGSFGEAFADRVSKRRGSAEDWRETVSRWRNALQQAAALSGMTLQANDSEAMFIKEIVAEIQGKVKSKTLSMPKHLTGIDQKVRKINHWLCDGSKNVSFMAICGIGGIGKTTIARHAFNLNCNKFYGSCFLSNVREAFEKFGGVNDLQRQLISDISSHKNSNIYSGDEGISKIKDVVWKKKVLLVLDDVEDDEQLERLLGDELDYFSQGSKIMVTTKNLNLLKANAPTIHDVTPMNDSDSIQLFSWYAFGKDKPDQGFVDISNKMIQKCQGLPLALQIIGRSLYKRKEDYWNATLDKLQEVPEAKLIQKLRVSYGAMEGESDRELFLEISCFFVGQNKDFAIMILGSLFHATIGLENLQGRSLAMIGLENLKDRCLLEYDEYDNLVMHQSVQDMGREICKENTNNPGERRRLWRYHDTFSVLKEKTGTSNIQALFLEDGSQPNLVDNAHTNVLQKLTMLQINLIEFCCRSEENDKYLETVAFKEMQKLRMLHINFLGGLNLKGSYKNFPNKIKWLRLIGWPLKYVPDDFPVKECVAIEIRFSGLTRLGLARTQVFRCLTILNLSNNKGLIRTPEFSKFRFPHLEMLNLEGCVNLKEVDESIWNLQESLKFLYLENCTSLRKLPKTIVKLHNLKELQISGCTNLEEFPEKMDQMKALTYFWASGISMHRILAGDTSLILPLGSLPGSLTILNLSCCGLSENCFPSSVDSNYLPFLEQLFLEDNLIRFLPEFIKRFTHHLKLISFQRCERLESLVELPEVHTLNVTDCVSLKQVTYQAGAGLKTVIQARGCGNLIWLEHKYKLIPIQNMANLLDTFAFIDWKAMESTNILFYNNTSLATRIGPIQGVVEGGRIFCLAFPGSHVPSSDGWESCSVDGNTIAEGVVRALRVDAPVWCHPHSASSNMFIVTLCFVYSLAEGMRRGIMDMINFDSIFVVIHNITKRLFLTFDPSWNGYNYIEESDKELDTTWVVSNWLFGPDMMESGDELCVGLEGKLVTESHVKVKKIACRIGVIISNQPAPTRTTRSVQAGGDDRIIYYGKHNMYV